MQGHGAIGQPGQVAGKVFGRHRGHADGVEQFAADAAGLEVDQGGGADVKGKAAAAEEAGATAGLAVCLEDDGAQPACLQSRGRCHARDAAADYRNVKHEPTPRD